jgi:RNA polymerase sigma-70 factor (ECF subfamily)
MAITPIIRRPPQPWSVSLNVRVLTSGLSHTLQVASLTDTARAALFDELVAQDWNRFHRYAYQLSRGNSDDTDDILAETLIDAFKAFDKFSGTGFDRWFFRMLTRNHIDLVRRAKVRQAFSLDTGLLSLDGKNVQLAGTVDPPDGFIHRTLSEPMQAALDSLNEQHRAALLLADVEGLDYDEISQVLALPLGTVRSRLHRARAKMRAALESYRCDIG